MATSTHFVAIFACYENQITGHTMNPLLAFSPLSEETDYSAPSHIDFISSTLQIFGKETTSVRFFIADNENLNRAIANQLQIPMIGCYSHRLNLAVEVFLQHYEEVLSLVHSLMVKLWTLRNSAKLRRVTELRPIQRNVTRWSSTFEMLKRFTELKEFIDTTDAQIAPLFPSSVQQLEIQDLHTHLEKFESVSKKIQEDSTTLWEARSLFDAHLEQYPALDHHLGASMSITHSPEFETIIYDYMGGKQISVAQREILKARVPQVRVPQAAQSSASFAETILQAKRQKLADIAERFFSKVRNVY